jgi:hypothetical protein
MRALRKESHWVTVAWLVLAALVGMRPARAEVSTDQAAAVVIYPYVTVDSAQSADTLLQISNTSTDPVVVSCFYETVGTVSPTAGCTSVATVNFQFQLTPRQPIGWRASQGLPVFPLDGVTRTGPAGTFNENSSIPPLPSDPFVGSLRCIAVNANLVPVERNVLVGTATLGQARSSTDSSMDSAQYNAIGIAAHVGAGNGDNTLVLGGATAEYDACPSMTDLSHFFEGAIEQAAQASTVSTTLVLIPCSLDLLSRLPIETEVAYEVHNEFEQQFSTTQTMRCRQVSALSALGTQPSGVSLFDVRVQGTLTGHTRIRTVSGSGLLTLAIETHTDLTDPARVTRAAFDAHMIGARSEADTLVILGGASPEETPTPTASTTPTLTPPAPTPTPPPTATATSTGTRTATATSTATIRPSATVTPTNTATTKPTSTPSATQTAPSATVTPGNNDDGCSIATGPHRTVTSLALLLGPALLLLASRRVRRA